MHKWPHVRRATPHSPAFIRKQSSQRHTAHARRSATLDCGARPGALRAQIGPGWTARPLTTPTGLERRERQQARTRQRCACRTRRAGTIGAVARLLSVPSVAMCATTQSGPVAGTWSTRMASPAFIALLPTALSLAHIAATMTVRPLRLSVILMCMQMGLVGTRVSSSTHALFVH